MAAAILWGVVISTFWVTLKDGDPAVLAGMATTLTVLAHTSWQWRSLRERVQRREDAYLDTIEMFTRPAAARLTGPQPAAGWELRRVK